MILNTEVCVKNDPTFPSFSISQQNLFFFLIRNSQQNLSHLIDTTFERLMWTDRLGQKHFQFYNKAKIEMEWFKFNFYFPTKKIRFLFSIHEQDFINLHRHMKNPFLHNLFNYQVKYVFALYKIGKF